MFLSPLDPDPLVSVQIWILLSSSKNSKKNLNSFCFVTSFYFLSLKNVISKSNKQKKIVLVNLGDYFLFLGKLQGADDKLGQFLNQSIKATDYSRNVFQQSLESCTSLVLHNVNKLSLFLKKHDNSVCNCTAVLKALRAIR
jgi:hypothetical protein